MDVDDVMDACNGVSISLAFEEIFLGLVHKTADTAAFADADFRSHGAQTA